MAFHLHVSTDLEILADLFREKIYEQKNPEHPLEPVTVTVQTQGMAVWLRQYLARKSRISMNLFMPFLRASIENELKRIYPESELDLSLHSQEQETWQIFSWLSAEEHREQLPELQNYLRNDPDLRKRFQISREIAKAFEQYRIYRPEMLIRWKNENSAPEDWQEQIYRALFLKERTLDVYLNRFSEEAARYHGPENGKTLSIFGISSMAPRFLDFFLNLSKYQEVHLFYLSPSEEYWADALTRQQAKRQNYPDQLREEMEKNNNPLLTAFGGQGRAFFRELLRSDLWDIAEEHPRTVQPGQTLLGALQDDIRNNRNGVPERILQADGSIFIENCHTRLREIQVLHDRVLREIETGREPGEILITSPDIEQYVSCIDSVFGTGPLAGHYTIADRSLHQSGVILPDLLKILSVARSDYSTSIVFSILENDLVLRKFHLTRSDLERIREWCSRAGIRWGVDERTREEQCGLKFDLFSWYHGIRRMLLGYAVKEDIANQTEMADLPMDFAEGKEAVPLGDFLNFIEELVCLRDQFSTDRKHLPQEWFQILKSLPDHFFDPEGEPDAIQERAALIRKLSELEYSSSICKEPIPFQVIAEILNSLELQSSSAGGFLRGRITFCSMIPMRTIPMPFVAVLGLNAGEFPRRDISPGFNLISRDPRETDRSGNQEDRYLLLETILSAREKLHIFYLGQSSKDNSEVFPTPPLAELIRYLEQILPSGNSGNGLILKHHLQPYADDYFRQDDRYFFTYSNDSRSAAEGIRRIRYQTPAPLPISDYSQESLAQQTLPDQISLENLLQFFRSPASCYLHHDKGILFQQRREIVPEDQELFQPNALWKYQVKEQILQAALNSADLKTFRQQLQKCGAIPLGIIGEEFYCELLEELQPFLAETFLRCWTLQENVSFSKQLTPQTEITGTIPLSRDRSRAVFFEIGKKDHKRTMKYWLIHLFLSAVQEGYEQTYCQFQDKLMALKPVDPAAAAETLLRFTAMRELGKTSLFPFCCDISKSQRSVTDNFRKTLISSFSKDMAAALVYRKEDFSDDLFCETFIHTAKLFYEGIKEERSPVL